MGQNWLEILAWLGVPFLIGSVWSLHQKMSRLMADHKRTMDALAVELHHVSEDIAAIRAQACLPASPGDVDVDGAGAGNRA